MKDISRRDFLKGAAASAIGLAAASISVPAFADDGAAGEGGLRYDENGVCINTRAEYFAATTPEVGEITSEETFDVVVIGAGNGGLVAAASAADLGGSVIVIEKSFGYTTWAGEIGAFNTKLEREKYGIH